MFRFDDLVFDYEPYPIGVAPDVFESELYEELVADFPPEQIFEYKEVLGHKYSLSEVNNAGHYHEFVQSHPRWKALYEWIKRPQFPYEVFATLSEHNIEMGIAATPASEPGRLRGVYRALRQGASVVSLPRLNSRFEFSMLPADGGCIKPHTDNPQKIVTLVVGMLHNEEWNDAYGGGTEVMKPRDIRRNYNFVNNQLEFDEVETVRTFDYRPNQCVVFIKTFNSLHAVRPMKGHGTGLMRKTLTINIEKLPGW
ncbi:MAG TPA: 2OG-Fe(II) oxygenase [Pyrinomonadaceae bacterium]|nr:2OG-Fe(II) oxygenase [Pyrinomonadaceae bacterium]